MVPQRKWGLIDNQLWLFELVGQKRSPNGDGPIRRGPRGERRVLMEKLISVISSIPPTNAHMGTSASMITDVQSARYRGMGP